MGTSPSCFLNDSKSRYGMQTCSITLWLRFFPRFIEQAENELEESTIKQIFIEWDFESNITEATEKKKLEYKVSIWYFWHEIFRRIWSDWRFSVTVDLLCPNIPQNPSLWLVCPMEAKIKNNNSLVAPIRGKFLGTRELSTSTTLNLHSRWASIEKIETGPL